jgi:glycosyltransferase involved in cell wall biosynthesis
VTRILFIPEDDVVATSERSQTLYRALKARHDVIGLRAPLDRFLYDPEKPKLPRYALYVLDKVALLLRGLLLARRHRAELVFCETAHHALAGAGIAKVLGIRSVWDSHGNVRLFAQSVGKGRVFTSLATFMEGFLGDTVDALVTVSERDAAEYARMGIPRSKIRVLPHCIDVPDPPGARTERGGSTPCLLFFGSFKYLPNREALDYINGILAPQLERDGARCEIRITGRDIPRLRFHPFLRALGFVPDLHAAIREADLCIVPVWKGVGVSTKVLDIMAAETPVVLSSFVAEGIPEIEDGVHALVAPTPEDFPGLVLKALSDLGACRTMAANARRLVEERYDCRLHAGLLDEILREVLGATNAEMAVR